MEKITVVGIGKLGLAFSLLLADAGYIVYGYDSNEDLVDSLQKKEYKGVERGISSLLKSAGSKFIPTCNMKDALDNSEIVYICVPTPSDENGAFSNEQICDVTDAISRHLDTPKLIIVKSTVMPGTMSTLKFEMEEKTHKTCGVDFGLCYNPEFFALGESINTLSNPDLVLIGESDPISGHKVELIHSRIVKNTPQVIHSNFENAELGKLFLNSFLTVKISYGNMMAELCEKISGADIDVVSRILESDHRVGKNLLSGGLSYGGPCLPRDNKAIRYFFRKILKKEDFLVKSADDYNNTNEDRIIETLKEMMGGTISGRNISILGLTYKPGTDVVERSGAILLVLKLVSEGAIISVHDPKGLKNAHVILGDTVVYCPTIKDCLNNTDLCIIAVPWDEYKYLTHEDFSKNMRIPMVYDCWRILKNHTAKTVFGIFFSLGRHA